MGPNQINVYARQVTETMSHHITRQGFGYSSPLEHAETNITYIWEGKLHGQRKDVVGSSNFRGNLDDLAQNLVLNIRGNPSPQHNSAGMPAYRIGYEVDESRQEQGSSSVETRALTPAEQWAFSVAFEKALKQ